MNISNTEGLSNLYSSVNATNKSAERISSGQRINRASDDAAGLALSNQMSSEIKGLNQSIRNANDGISMLQTKESSLSNISEGVHRLRELALQSSNGTLNDKDRSAIDKEAQQLISEINNTVENSRFNGQQLLSNNSSTDLQVGPNSGDTLNIEQNDFNQTLDDAGFNTLDFSSANGAQSALSVLDQVHNDVNKVNADVGAGINRLSSTINSLGESSVQTQASRSRIQDADLAKEVSDRVNNLVKQDTAIAMQSLANQQKSSVLRFLDGIS